VSIKKSGFVYLYAVKQKIIVMFIFLFIKDTSNNKEMIIARLPHKGKMGHWYGKEEKKTSYREETFNPIKSKIMENVWNTVLIMIAHKFLYMQKKDDLKGLNYFINVKKRFIHF